MNHYIGTLEDRDLARMLIFLRLGDANDLEETLQECENMEVREVHAYMGSKKFRHRLTSQATQIPAKPDRAVKAIHVESESSVSEADSGGSDIDSDRRNVYMAAAADHAQNTGDPVVQNERFDQKRHYDRGKSQTVCTHCESKRHDDRGCWK